MYSPVTCPRLSRRSFLRVASAAGIAAPVLTEAHLAWAAHQTITPVGAAPARPRARAVAPPPGAVLINANENPLGPCKAACEAIAAIAPKGGRYDVTDETGKLTKTFASQNDLKEEYIAVYAGSSEPLHYSVLAFTSPARSLVMADPSYEAPGYAANAVGAKTIKVPLSKDHSHDIKAMIAADPQAGVLYICNPNNPTGTLTAKEDIVWALKHKPAGAILLVDEAYIHLADAPDTLDLVRAGEDVVVLRTFSKIYGMAGIRCGLAVGRPDLLAKLKPYGMNAMPITGSAAANVSLLDPALVPERKKAIADIRNDTFAWLTANKYDFIPSVSNCFMINTGRDGKSVIAAMKEKNVFIGRTWPVWPNAVRITVGSREDMAAFQTAFHEVMSSPATAAQALSVHDSFAADIAPTYA